MPWIMEMLRLAAESQCVGVALPRESGQRLHGSVRKGLLENLAINPEQHRRLHSGFHGDFGEDLLLGLPPALTFPAPRRSC